MGELHIEPLRPTALDIEFAECFEMCSEGLLASVLAEMGVPPEVHRGETVVFTVRPENWLK